MSLQLQDEINKTLSAASDSFRGTPDNASYKQYTLALMFLKCLSDYWKGRYQVLKAQYKDEELVHQLQSERFVLDDSCTFDHLAAHKYHFDLGAIINKALVKIEEDNYILLGGVFGHVDFNRESNAGRAAEHNRRLQYIISVFQSLSFHPAEIGNAWMYVIEWFAEGPGKKGGELYITPRQVSRLLARLMAPPPGSRIYDPTCGSGSLLITMAKEMRGNQDSSLNNFALYGQEINSEAHALSRMNLFLHELDTARIELGDTLNNPRLIEGNTLMKFDVVVAQPPFSVSGWGAEAAMFDAYGRFQPWDIPPKSKGDYAFILHMIASAGEGGRVGVIVPHGVLYRGSSEGRIRQKLVEANLLEAVIGLPDNLFADTTLPTAIILFARNRSRKEVLFVDASRDYEPSKRQNKLRDEDIERIVRAYEMFSCGDAATDHAYCAVVSPSQLAANDFNLNIARYINTVAIPNETDAGKLQSEINDLVQELARVRAEMAGYFIKLRPGAGFDAKKLP